MANWKVKYDRRSREWGAYSACRLAYLVNSPRSPEHGKRHELPAGWYAGAGGRDRKFADEWAATLNASAAYVAIPEDHK